MSHDQLPHPLPAPCIIDAGIVVNKEDMRRVLSSLGRVYYIHLLDDQVQSQGEGCVMEVFSEPHQSTLIANRTLYLNVQSFDYLELDSSPEGATRFKLIQDNRQLRLIPLSNPLQERATERDFDVDALEAMVTQVLSAKWDVQIDNDEFPF
ncbi:MAG: hypothetical protein SVX43_13155 [Cyanobacteriota bacterium]|nr:hypothetical protein [Cyanobacteriota bacterium]